MRTASRGYKSRERRRESAEECRVARAKRSAKDQLARLDAHGHRALKERARLIKQIGDKS